ASWRSHWSAPALPGKKIVLAGRLPKYIKTPLTALIQEEGGEIVAEVAPDVSLVIVADATATSPPAAKKAEQLNNKSLAAIEILSLADFHAKLAPTGDQAVEMLKAGEPGRQRWRLNAQQCDAKIDLRGRDLRGVDLSDLPLHNVILDDADLRGANLTKTTRAHGRRVKLDGANLTASAWDSLERCSLIDALATGLVVNHHYGVEQSGDSDFTRAKLPNALLQELEATGAKFTGADLSGACLLKSNWQGVDFTGATLRAATIRESICDDAAFVNADLQRADAAGSSFRNADFRGANLREANLSSADLTGARLDGADLTDANLARTKVDAAQLATTYGATPPEPRVWKPGRAMKALDPFAASRNHLSFGWETKGRLGRHRCWGNYHPLTLTGRAAAQLYGFVIRESGPGYAFIADGATFGEAFPALLDYLGPEAEIVEGSFSTRAHDFRGVQESRAIALSALYEAFGRDAPTPAEQGKAAAAKKRARVDLNAAMLAELRGGPAGVAKFNARPVAEFAQMDQFAKVNLSSENLDGLTIPTRISFMEAKLNGASLVNTTWTGADLSKAKFDGAIIRDSRFGPLLPSASFNQATLERVDFRGANLHRASFHGATLTGCTFDDALLLDADFASATCRDCGWKNAAYNERTQLPPGVSEQDGLKWQGEGLPPHELAAARERERVAIAATTSTDSSVSPDAQRALRRQRRDEFLDRVRTALEPSKLANALAMLKAEKFELFVELRPDHLVGVVRSQSNPELVYACRLASDGSYSCCTQKLNVCGGLRGSPCKHLLVLALGLERQDAVAPETLGLWLLSTRRRKPQLDKEQTAELLLRYQGAQTGEIDWRPTETTPEDFYVV
ncbi:MAG TPA: pentapeptide repeat-containing protein, partial [Pirellulales bacterium]